MIQLLTVPLELIIFWPLVGTQDLNIFKIFLIITLITTLNYTEYYHTIIILPYYYTYYYTEYYYTEYLRTIVTSRVDTLLDTTKEYGMF